MTIQNGDILRCALRFDDPNGKDFVNVYHVQVISRGASAEEDYLQEVGAYLLDLYEDYLVDVSTGYVSHDMKCERVTWAGGKEVTVEAFPVIDLSGLTGGSDAPNDTLPAFVSPVISFRTAGVRTIPKKYLMAPGEGFSEAAGLTSAALADIATFIAKAVDNIVFGGAVAGTIRIVTHSKSANDWIPLIAGVATKYLSHQDRRAPTIGS